jgi:amino-acid N-acetyltransferase
MAIESGDSAAIVVKLAAADLPQLQALLQQNSLPTDDCEAQLPAFFGIFEADRLIAAGGLEVAANDGLLRSVVVDTAHRGRGLARAITHFLIGEARRLELDAIYLLTETADDYFTRFGFVRVGRELAPQAIARTRQFAGLCPDSAVFMRLTLDPR